MTVRAGGPSEGKVEAMGYDDWKARAPDPKEDAACERCGNAAGECECNVEVEALAGYEDVEALTDEDVRALVDEVKWSRSTIAIVEDVLRGLEVMLREFEGGVIRDEQERIVLLLRAALGQAT